MSDFSDEQRKETIKLLLQDLRTASKLVDSLGDRISFLEDDLHRPDFMRKIAKTLTNIFELESNLFDLEPRLTYDFLKPSLNPVDLDESLERLLSTNNLEFQDKTINSAVRQSTIQEFKSYMKDETALKFIEATKLGTEYEFAKKWWDAQAKPFIPVVRVYKKLKSDRRYIRFHAAKLLEEKFKVKIWDNVKNDVDLHYIDKLLSK